MAHHGTPARGAQCVERVRQRIADFAGGDELAQQRVHQARHDEPVAQGVVVVPLVGGAEQLARPEEQRWRVLAACGDDVVGGVLEPGPQPAGQAGVEARARRGVPDAAAPGPRLRCPCPPVPHPEAPTGAGDGVRRGPSGQCAHGV